VNPSLPVIHAVTSDEIVARDDFLSLAGAVMRALGPRGAVHLRAPGATGQQLYRMAAALAPLQQTTGCWVVVNDRVDIALAGAARGVQLTSRSLTTGDAARAIAAAAPLARTPAIGASVHTVDDARAAVAGGAATWLVVGHVFATPSHADEPGRGLAFLREVCGAVTLPVIAIGGVRPDRVAALLANGAYGVAAIRGIWRADDAEAAAGDYLSAHDAVRDALAGGASEPGLPPGDAAGSLRRG
jgi:thiamine-phosphate diphosphorylase